MSAMTTTALMTMKRLAGVQGQLGRVGEERCAFIRALVVVNQALMSRQHLEEQAGNWLREAGTTPPGNGIDKSDWEVCSDLAAPLILPCSVMLRMCKVSIGSERAVPVCLLSRAAQSTKS